MVKGYDEERERTYHCPDWAYYDNVEPVWKFDVFKYVYISPYEQTLIFDKVTNPKYCHEGYGLLPALEYVQCYRCGKLIVAQLCAEVCIWYCGLECAVD